MKKNERSLINLRPRIKKSNYCVAYCQFVHHAKKIRDDEGYWNQVESYITEHSEAQFSHSICPECDKKLYSGF